ncbi:hypothetical protein [Nocardia spumae]|nr:hypothetical protein [Nocardia spumae]
MLRDWPAAEVTEFAAFPRQLNTDIERLDGQPWPRPEVSFAPG